MLYSRIIKPVVDRCVASVLLAILWPLIVVISLIQYFIYGKIFYIQERPGLNAKSFKLYKFQSMINDPSLAEESRVTTFGKVLRATSLDELPQLVNILKGDMSFIGPRPLLKEYLKLYSKEHAERHQVKPGLTGLAQINGRNNISWKRRLDLDRSYVMNVSFFNDFKILLGTIKYVLSPAPGETTPMKRFEGY